MRSNVVGDYLGDLDPYLLVPFETVVDQLIRVSGVWVVGPFVCRVVVMIRSIY